MAKKLTVDTDLTEGIKMLGLVTHLKDYRLAYHINRELDIQLKKYADFQPGEGKETYSWYYYSEGNNYPNITLISNNHKEGRLITDHKMDYMILVKNVFESKLITDFLTRMRKITDLTLVFPLEISKLKNFDLFLEAEEMHELKQVIRPKKN